MGKRYASVADTHGSHVTEHVNFSFCWLPEGVIPYRDSRPDEGPGSCNFVFLLLNSLMTILNVTT